MDQGSLVAQSSRVGTSHPVATGRLVHSDFYRGSFGLIHNRMQIKKTIDPFTGCFASHIPTTLVALRLTFHVGELLAKLCYLLALEVLMLPLGGNNPLLQSYVESAKPVDGAMQVVAIGPFFAGALKRGSIASGDTTRLTRSSDRQLSPHCS